MSFLLTVDGDVVAVDDGSLLELGEGVDYDAIRALGVGQVHRDGGGAAPEWQIVRVS